MMADQPASPARRRAHRIAAAALAIVLLTAGGLVFRVALLADRPDGRESAAVRAPEGERVRVEILNAAGTRGLARRATAHLRDRGFDVVHFGTADRRADTTLVLDRRGRPAWALLVRDALGVGQTEARPDSSRHVDITVLLGGDWRPPAEPFYP